ncbi:GIY-YIG nuclease family protein [Streptomyces sp. NPDC059979]|uniref:GIY-YIG nuclease family protein n=1 Tax=Streptomyces sp. NPDC059979 TaxID=3347021 RepID=UPI0036819EC1
MTSKPPDGKRQRNQEQHRQRRYEASAARAHRPGQPWVYLIGSDEVRPVKIGISGRPESRLVDMQVGSPVLLRLLWKTPGSYEMEQALHSSFRAFHRHGEWFDFGDEDPVAVVAATAALLGYWRPPAGVVGLPEQPPANRPAPALPRQRPERPDPGRHPQVSRSGVIPPPSLPPLPPRPEPGQRPQTSVGLPPLPPRGGYGPPAASPDKETP